MVGTEERLDPRALAGCGQRDPVLPGHILLAFDHQGNPHKGESYPLRAVTRALVWTLYAACVLVWSSTWVVIAVGLEDIEPFFARHPLRAGGRRPARRRRADASLAAHRFRALGDRRPAAVRHDLRADLLGRAVRDLGPDRGPVRRPAALRRAARRRRAAGRAAARPLLLGVGIALVGLVVAFSESLDIGGHEHTALAALAVVLSPLASAVGNVAIKQRGTTLDPLVMNGWAMLIGGVALLIVSAPTEVLGRDRVVVGVGRLDPLPRGVRHGLHVRHDHRPAARAAHGHGLVHLDRHSVRCAGGWARWFATSS